MGCKKINFNAHARIITALEKHGTLTTMALARVTGIEYNYIRMFIRELRELGTITSRVAGHDQNRAGNIKEHSLVKSP